MKLKKQEAYNVPEQPEHLLCTVWKVQRTNELHVRIHFNPNWVYPMGYRYWMFRGIYGRVLIAIKEETCTSDEYVGKLLRVVKEEHYKEHRLIFVGEFNSQGEKI